MKETTLMRKIIIAVAVTIAALVLVVGYQLSAAGTSGAESAPRTDVSAPADPTSCPPKTGADTEQDPACTNTQTTGKPGEAPKS